MYLNFFHTILAVLGLGLLVFIHELGHFFVARWVGMRVEAFGIGFGRPIYSWERNGVKWNICWLPFGGYVKIAGMEKEGGIEPEAIPDGFFGKRPIDRIKVALAGPAVNLLFAFLVFIVLWGIGGREKSFSELTQHIGWVDPKSELYEKGLRPGDVVSSYNGRPVLGAKDHVYAAMFNEDPVAVQGYHIDYVTGEHKAFDYKVKRYPNPLTRGSGILTVGVLSGASYLNYDYLPGNGENALPKGSPIADSGLQYGDRIVWIDGERIFSLSQVVQILNSNHSLFTLNRGGQTLTVRVPRVELSKLWFDTLEKEEIVDWQHEAGFLDKPAKELFFIPYNLTDKGVVEGRLNFLDKDDEKMIFLGYSDGEEKGEGPLKAGDRIVAVDGHPIDRTHQLLTYLQEHRTFVIVSRGLEQSQTVAWPDIEKHFESEISWVDVDAVAKQIGSSSAVTESGPIHLLKPIVPIHQDQFVMTANEKLQLEENHLEARRRIEESTQDPEERKHLLSELEERENRLYLGVPLQDRRVTYNPDPFTAFYDVWNETVTTLRALVSGYLAPKWLSGPVGIVQVIQVNWGIGVGEGLFWMAAISMNLGILNLLPIPVLDGGYISLALYEMVTGHRVKAKTVERLVIPFALLLISLLLLLTYYDLSRLYQSLFR